MQSDFLLGIMAAFNGVAALFFARFWRDTGDRLFAIFALAFLLLVVQRFLLSILGQQSEWQASVYLVRLAAYVMILVAILDKNRGDQARAQAQVDTPGEASSS
jgi:Ca2+/Na+ antiporter